VTDCMVVVEGITVVAVVTVVAGAKEVEGM
jgi:hypothetical protein